MGDKIRTRIKVWLLKKLIDSLTEDAIQSNNHILADQLISIGDVIH